MANSFKLRLVMQAYPACYTAFDILYYKNQPVMDRPLKERKKLLENTVSENKTLATSRAVEDSGITLYELAAWRGLEGVVAKRKDSFYFPGKRTKDWIKFKNLKDDDFVVCGFIEKGDGVVSIILGQYDHGKLMDKGHVTLGISRKDYQIIFNHPRSGAPFNDDKDAVWIKPSLVCTVQYMERTVSGKLRQPVFKGLRDDKEAGECICKT